MKGNGVLVPLAALIVVACGGGDEAGAGNGAESTPGAATAPAPPAPAGTVDTAGVGTNPPTAGGQVVDTAAVSGPVDTAQGTPTAP